MNRTLRQLFMRLLGLLAMSWACVTAYAEQKTAIADNGREVILKDNGEWEYATDALFATTPNGQRIRLNADQRWQPASDMEAPTYQPAPLTTRLQDTVSINNEKVVLDQLQIEHHRTTAGKNTRLRSNLVFYLALSGETAQNFATDDFVVKDSRGRNYPVILVTTGASPVGGQPRLVVRAKGSPRWWGIKFFSLQIGAGSLGNTEPLELRKPMSDVVTKDVDSLPEDEV